MLVQLSPVLSQDVKIGTQVWMSKNLDVSTFRNGEAIRYAASGPEWQDAVNKREAAWRYYNNDPKNGEIYGKLYNWYAVNDSRGLAPLGYHIPSDDEWSVLTEYLGGKQNAGIKMKSKKGWNNKNGDNSSGFNGLPGGYCYYDGGSNHIGNYGFWWSSTEDNVGGSWKRGLYGSDSRVGRGGDGKGKGFSVRCIKD
jgi:uncharacterized protein (TIGR02145 family)